MKLAKKVLSVVLAVAIALGAFAVAASANGNPDTAEYQAKIWLTGAISDLSWTSKTKMSLTEGDESDPGATIEAQPGDEIMVRVYMTNNYYVHTIQSNLFFSSALLDAGEIYTADTGAACTEARRNKMQVFNTNNYFNELHAAKTASSNCWSMQTADANQKVDENWPTDDDGNELFNHDDWKWNRFYVYAVSSVGETCILEDDTECIISMPVRIPENIAPGTYYITIPEGLEQRSAKIYGATRIYESGIAEGETEPNDVFDANSQLTPNMKYADENQYFDYSESTLTIVIPGEAGVDTSALEAKITEAANLLTADITADSIAALNTAIEAGNAALTSDNQDTIDAAVTTLTDAIANVEYLADFTELNKAIAKYEALNAADWDATSFAAATEKYDAATAIDQKNTADQDAVDTATSELNAAIDALDAALDYSALEAKYNELAGKDVANYTDDTVARFNTALANAKSLIDNKNAADQDEINAAYTELVDADAALALKDADYTALSEAIAKYKALNAADWTSASYAAATEKYEAADAIPEGLDITAQDTIDAAAAELEEAITALVPATGANYAVLKAAIAEAEALVVENYTTDSYAAVATALATAKAVPEGLTSEQQTQIDEAADALNKALDDLVEADADYSAVNTAITAAKAKIAEADEGTLRYSDEYIAEVNAAIDAVVTGLKKKDQATVDGYANAINALIDAPVYRPYDYTAINDHITAIEANPVDFYNAESYAAYLAKKEALVWDYTHEQYAKAKLQQIQFLKVTVAEAAEADYTAVNDAKAEFDALDEAKYTPESYAAVKAAVDAVDWDLNENYQTQVDAYADAINEALDKLEEVVIEYADYTVLTDAIADAANYAAADYTTATYAVLTEKVAAGQAIVDGEKLLAADQAIVNDAATAITDAIAGLKKLANLDALKAAIAEGDGYDPNVWTEETYSVLAAAVAAGRALMEKELSEDDQPDVDKATADITDAISKMERKPVLSSISAINWTPSEDTHNTFNVVVNGRMAMIQFIEEDGGTRTYDRYHKNVKITSYNAAGEEVNSLDRSVAYEIWEITTNLIGPDVKARAKYLEGTSYIWETETYNFTVETLEPVVDAEIRSITPAATSGKKGAVATTVVVGPDAQGVRFVMDNGTTTTYYADKATVLENGDLQFTGNAWANHAGLNTIIVKVRVNNAWVEAGTVEYTVE